MSVYKHSEVKEYVKKKVFFKEKYKLHGYITREFLGLKLNNFQGFVFI